MVRPWSKAFARPGFGTVPRGFEWGYGGSGPADLALNILLAATVDRDFAARHHQAFKWRFVASLPHSGGTIRAAAVLDWIMDRESGQPAKEVPS